MKKVSKDRIQFIRPSVLFIGDDIYCFCLIMKKKIIICNAAFWKSRIMVIIKNNNISIAPNPLLAHGFTSGDSGTWVRLIMLSRGCYARTPTIYTTIVHSISQYSDEALRLSGQNCRFVKFPFPFPIPKSDLDTKKRTPKYRRLSY